MGWAASALPRGIIRLGFLSFPSHCRPTPAHAPHPPIFLPRPPKGVGALLHCATGPGPASHPRPRICPPRRQARQSPAGRAGSPEGGRRGRGGKGVDGGAAEGGGARRLEPPPTSLHSPFTPSQLSDFGLCAPLGDVVGGGDDGGAGAAGVGAEPSPSGAAPLAIAHRPPARRALAFSTVGTPDYVAPEVLLRRGRGVGVFVGCGRWGPGVCPFLCIL